jgi:hypothetical protein
MRLVDESKCFRQNLHPCLLDCNALHPRNISLHAQNHENLKYHAISVCGENRAILRILLP